jgi:hypothetical protein
MRRKKGDESRKNQETRYLGIENIRHKKIRGLRLIRDERTRDSYKAMDGKEADEGMFTLPGVVRTGSGRSRY